MSHQNPERFIRIPPYMDCRSDEAAERYNQKLADAVREMDSCAVLSFNEPESMREAS